MSVTSWSTNQFCGMLRPAVNCEHADMSYVRTILWECMSLSFANVTINEALGLVDPFCQPCPTFA